MPEKPQAPETEQLGDTIEISWREPYNGGSTITSYTLYFEHSDGVSYSTDATYCQPTAHLVVTKCQIPSLHFTQAPYLIPWAGEIRVKVVASNWLGDSAESDVGGGAFIFRVPDAPVNLANVAGVTMGNQIGISWQEGPENGGLPVLDYRISFDQGSGQDTPLETGVQSLTYTTHSLIPGVTYRFTVAARNDHGYSEESVFVDVLAAQNPDQPDAPIT